MDKIKKPLPMPLRYAINLAVFAAFLFGVNALITGGSVPNYYTKVIVLCGINIILAVSLNVATGYLGQLPLDMVEVGIKLGIDFAPAPNTSCARFSRR